MACERTSVGQPCDVLFHHGDVDLDSDCWEHTRATFSETVRTCATALAEIAAEVFVGDDAPLVDPAWFLEQDERGLYVRCPRNDHEETLMYFARIRAYVDAAAREGLGLIDCYYESW